ARYILRRNPLRAQELAAAREDKYRTLGHAVAIANQYLTAHPRAKATRALEKLTRRAQQLRIAPWTTLTLEHRTLKVEKNTHALARSAKLDGCYVLKTDLPASAASKELIHERYKDLALVEWAFRESKTVHLEMRPIYVRLESRTRGHAFVVMLAYLLIHELAKRWATLNLTVQEGLDQLATLCLTEVHVPHQPIAYQIPSPRDTVQQLFNAATVHLPNKLPRRGIVVTTKTKLPHRRKLK
ncbi:MAG: IS1634 family transposase, partial [Burkholderiales bacterium]